MKLCKQLLGLGLLQVATLGCQVFTSNIPAKNMATKASDDDPCLEIASTARTVEALVSSNAFLAARSAIDKAASSDGREHTVTFGRDPKGNLTSSPLKSGGNKTGTVTSNWPGAFADLHNHPDNLPPSPGDFYGIVGIANAHPGYHTRIVFLADGTIFALVVVNQSLANKFVAQHPKVTGPGYSPKFPEPVITDFYNVRDHFILRGYAHKDADTFGMAFILDKYHTGLALLKPDQHGPFKRLVIQEKVGPGASAYLVVDCP